MLGYKLITLHTKRPRFMNSVRSKPRLVNKNIKSLNRVQTILSRTQEKDMIYRIRHVLNRFTNISIINAKLN